MPVGVKDAFRHAVLHMQSSEQKSKTIADDAKWKLYGYSKQANDGDCRLPCPPS